MKGAANSVTANKHTTGLAIEPPAMGIANPAQLQTEGAIQMQEKDERMEKPSPNGLPKEVNTQMESSIGADFSDVKVHPNSSKAPEVGALAYTQGSDIHFAPGQFQPETPKGQALLGHELTHVVQQREGRVTPTTQVKGMAVNDDPGLEKEADQMGKKTASR